MNQEKMMRNGILAGGVAVAVVIAFFAGRSSVTAPPSKPAADPVASVTAGRAQPNRVEIPTTPSIAETPREAVAERPAERPVERPAAAAPPPDRPIAAARLAAANGAAAPANANPLVQSLTLARRHMERARRALSTATAGNHGGFVEKARTDADAAAANLAAATAYAQEHPELKDLPPENSPESDAAIQRIKARTFPAPNTQTNMVNALEAIQATVDAVQQAGGAGLGGTRDKLIADLDHAATNVAEGFNVAYKGGDNKAGAPAAPTGALP